ncbi:MAG: cation:proton antiporter [Vicinamibacterales bacterium]
MGIAADLTIVVVAGLCGGLLARLLRQPLLLGYLLAGVLVGPHTGGITVSEGPNIELLAEIGVTLLLFGLGLELSLKDLAPVQRVAFVGTPVQIFLTMGLGAGLGRWWSLGWETSIWLGAILSLSSTMVVLKTLQAQGRIGTLSSRVMLGMLIVQDIAFVPMLILLPRFGDPAAGFAMFADAAAKAALFLLLMFGLGTKVLPSLMGRVARSGSRELFLLATTAVALGVALLTHLAGVSSALGAFVAGVVLSESDYSHQALSEIIPLRDVFSLLFFASVGMLIDPSQMLSHWPQVVTLVGVAGAGKACIFFGVTRAFGYRNVVPLAAALGLFQIGEFSFVLAHTGFSSGAIDTELYSLVLDAAVVTMALSPTIAGLTSPLYSLMGRRRAPEQIQTTNMAPGALGRHVVVAGAGRVGTAIAGVLEELRLPFVLVELDHRRFDDAHARGFPVVYGDATRPTVLAAARAGSADLVLVTTPAYDVARGVLEQVRHLNPSVPVVVRAETVEAMADFQRLGVAEVVQPELEASLEMTRQALLHLRLPILDILQLTDRLRVERYAPMYERHGSEYELLARLGTASRLVDLRWVRIGPGSRLAGSTIGEQRIRAVTGASLVAAVGAQGPIANPGPDRRLDEGDLVAVVGTHEQVLAFEREAAAARPGR